MIVSPPPVVFDGRQWSREILTARATWWLSHLPVARQQGPPVALIMAPHPDTIALFFVLASRPVPIVLLPTDARAWRSRPDLPAGTLVVAAPAVKPPPRTEMPRQCVPVTVPEPPLDLSEVSVGGLEVRASGVVFLTSGSTGGPKPVFRRMDAVLAQGKALNETLPRRPGGVLAMLSLAGSQGFVGSLIQATLLGVPLGLLPQVDHRSTLQAFASNQYDYVSTTPYWVSLLSRCPIEGSSAPAPGVIRVSGGRLPRTAFDAFRRRFGVTPQPQYGTTEHGTISLAPHVAAEIRPESVGRALGEVRLRVGDPPGAACESGETGRVWVQTPWRMDGYGYPPHVERPVDREGWLPTEDLGVMDERGELTLVGRVDQCFKVASGHLVSPEYVADALLGDPAIRDAVVVPIPSERGTVIGALVEGEAQLDADAVRSHADRVLPMWLQPAVVAITPALPRAGGGKPDRRRAAEVLLASV